MFDISDIPMTVTPGNGITVVSVNPGDLYPAMVARVQAVLAGEQPVELFALSERGGMARADTLVANARALPAEAWTDALLPRDQFSPWPYFTLVERNGRERQDLLEQLPKADRAQALRMIQRGHALEICLGWFLHALRLKYGALDTTITRDEAYKL